MDFINVFCICGAILALFSVGESVLEKLGMNKYQVAIFLIVSTLLDFFPRINYDQHDVSLNCIFYAVVFAKYLFKTKCVKNLAKMLVISAVCLALIVCYNSLNLLKFEFAYFQPYLLLCAVLGVISAFLTENHTTCFCGLFVATIVSEIIKSGNNFLATEFKFCFGDNQFLCLMVISLFFYMLTMYVKKVVESFRQKLSSKKSLKKQNI